MSNKSSPFRWSSFQASAIVLWGSESKETGANGCHGTSVENELGTKPEIGNHDRPLNAVEQACT